MRKEFPVLYKLAKTNKMLMWSICVDDESGFPTIITTSGYVDGKQNSNKRVVRKGTNAGKANAKTPFEHAVFLATNSFNSRKDSGFLEDIEKAKEGVTLPLTPMLAAPFNKKILDKDFFPMYVQPKFNGVRCTMYRHEGDETFWSRARKPFTTLDFMLDEIRKFFGEYSPDGEIYIHGMPLQNIISLLKRKQPGTEKLRYVVYDLAIPDKTFEERLSILEGLYSEYIMTYGAPQYIELASTRFVRQLTELEQYNKSFVEMEYEGTIIRKPKALYRFNERTGDLMKYKNFQDSEFEIVDALPEVYYDKLNHVHKEIVIWVCRSTTNPDRTFHVRPLGSVDEKEELYSNRAQYIGKMLTVRYLELSTDGVPVGNPVGLAIRDYE